MYHTTIAHTKYNRDKYILMTLLGKLICDFSTFTRLWLILKPNGQCLLENLKNSGDHGKCLRKNPIPLFGCLPDNYKIYSEI